MEFRFAALAFLLVVLPARGSSPAAEGPLRSTTGSEGDAAIPRASATVDTMVCMNRESSDSCGFVWEDSLDNTMLLSLEQAMGDTVNYRLIPMDPDRGIRFRSGESVRSVYGKVRGGEPDSLFNATLGIGSRLILTTDGFIDFCGIRFSRGALCVEESSLLFLASGSHDVASLFKDHAPVLDPPREAIIRKPEYPMVARKEGMEGRVTAEARLSERGRVVRVEILSSPSDAFHDAVIQALKKCEFHPARVDGVPVPSRIIVPFDFYINTGKRSGR